ncbi:MAG: hypothetical protein ACRELY_18870, partial [Polyangiaceae bacterium]
ALGVHASDPRQPRRDILHDRSSRAERRTVALEDQSIDPVLMIAVKPNDIVQCKEERDGLVFNDCYRVQKRDGVFIWVSPCKPTDDKSPCEEFAFSIFIFRPVDPRLWTLD